MSAPGQNRRSRPLQSVSALHPRADASRSIPLGSDGPIPDVTSSLVFLLGDMPPYRGKFLLMCSNSLVNSCEPSTAFYRLDFDKKLDKLTIELAAGVDRDRQRIKVSTLHAKKMRGNVLEASEVDRSFGANSLPDRELSIHPHHQLANNDRAIRFPIALPSFGV